MRWWIALAGLYLVLAWSLQAAELVVAAIAAAIIAVALSQSGGKQGVQITGVTGSNASDTVAKMQQLIDNNTR